GRGGRLAQAVIADVGAAQAHTTDRHGLGRAGRFAGEGTADSSSAHGDIVAAHDSGQRGRAHINGGRGRGVIDLVVRGDAAHGQCFGRDVRRGGRGAGGQQIVG